MTTPDLDGLRTRNQQRIDALRDQVIARREYYHENTAGERAHGNEADALRDDRSAEGYRRDDDEQLDEDTNLHSGLGY